MRSRSETAGRGRDHGRDRGSATVWAVACSALLCLVFTAVLALGQVVMARHRVATAADMAALAAADGALSGPEAACGVARQVAVAQRATVVRCALDGEIADLTAEIRAGPHAVRARSRAGPAHCG